jgi:hypothetical protein
MNAVLKPVGGVAQPGPYIETITPEYALLLLERNTANRPMRHMLAQQYAQAMERGEWAFNGDTIRIADDGTILDGQHRLHAIVLSNKPQQYIVVRGLPRDTFKTIDIGSKRKASDALAIRDEKNPNVLAAALRWIVIINQQLKRYQNPTPSQIMAALDQYPNTRQWTSYYAGRSDLKAIFDSSLVSVATLSSVKHGDGRVEDFLDQLGTGEGLSRTDPAYVLRARAIQNKMNKARILPPDFVPLTIKAFNAHMEGRQIQILRMRDDEQFPTI